MRDSIWATFFHSVSTDDETHHFRCPAGEDSRCFWQQALANGEEPPSHEDHVSSIYLCHEVAKKLIPVYQCFSSEPCWNAWYMVAHRTKTNVSIAWFGQGAPRQSSLGKNGLTLPCHLPSCVSMKATWVCCVWWMICGCLQLCQSLIVLLGRMKWDATKLMRQTQNRLDLTGSNTPRVSAVTCLPKQPGKIRACSRHFESGVLDANGTHCKHKF